MQSIHQLSARDALASLKTGLSGLSEVEVARRLDEFGRNEVESVARVSIWLRIFTEFTRFFSVILWVAAALAFLAEWGDPGQGMARIGCAIVIVIVVSGLFSFWQEYRVEKMLAALRDLLPQQAQVLRDGAVTRVPAVQLVPGDIVYLEPGDNVPADCRLIEAFGVRVNNASITGESLPKARDADAATADQLIDSRNVVLAGTSMVAGQAKAVVFATGMRTEFGKIARLTQTAGDDVSPLRREIAQLSRVTALLAVLIGGTFFVIGWAIGVPIWKAFIFAIGIIVAMVPEGLLPTLTLALVLATRRMAKRNVLIRYLPSVETLGSATVICTDKTGTLTQNRMSVQQLYLGDTIESPDGLATNTGVAERHRAFFANGPDVPRPEGIGARRHVVVLRRSDGGGAGADGAAVHVGQSASAAGRRAAVRRRPHAVVDGASNARRPRAPLQGRAGDGASAVRSRSDRRRHCAARRRRDRENRESAANDGTKGTAGAGACVQKSDAGQRPRRARRGSDLSGSGRAGRSAEAGGARGAAHDAAKPASRSSW